MDLLDWGVVVVYFSALVFFAGLIGRGQSSLRDYYLHDNKIRWWESGLSTMATQLGAISFVSAPAFVAVADDGGLSWLCYELGVPIGLLVVMIVILPAVHRRRFLSIYEYLERRFDRGVRVQVAMLFQLGRALATAVSILAGGLIASTAVGISTETAILVIGAFTILYAVIGGMRAVVLSDVLQMGVVLVGIVVCAGLAIHAVGWEAGWAAFDPARSRILDFSHAGLEKGETYAFWPMLIGGIFLYASYYGCDQSQVQRELSVGTLADARKSLVLNALGRFPVVLLYCVMGVFVGTAISAPEGMARLMVSTGMTPGQLSATLASEPDRMLPLFILSFLPHGVIGLMFIAILSALMSSMDSAINSLSAVTIRDVYQMYIRPNAEEAHYLRASRICTVFWGIFCMAAALAMYALSKGARETTIVLINAVGSLLYGPILAAFSLGIKTRFADARSVRIGIWAGIAVNAAIWLLTEVSWLWWNVIGFVTVVGVSALLSRHRIGTSTVALETIDKDTKLKMHATHLMVCIYALLIILFCWWLQQELSG